MMNLSPTPPETLRRARRQAMQAGLRYVYTGNMHDMEGDTTFCHACRAPLIIRDWYEVLEYLVTPDGKCPGCSWAVSGHYDARPGDWGRRRQPVVMTV